MENCQNYAQLLARIEYLKMAKIAQEVELKEAVKTYVQSLHPTEIIKQSIQSMTHDQGLKMDVTKLGLTVGANALIDQVLGRNRSIKGFLSALLLENMAAGAINRNASEIVAVFGRLFKKKTIKP